jgi:hypothetical protein
MRARTRLFLDSALLIGFIAAYRPTWTGISLHQWLCIAIVAPALVHLIVNWEWAVRIIRTFVKKLFSASRLNFVVDSLLLVSTVAVTVSGFMVSPDLIAPLGIRVAHPLEWHLVHSWTANATILIVLLHTGLHWRWLLAAANQLAGPDRPSSARRAGTPGLGAAAVMATAVARSGRTARVGSAGRSGARRGVRAASRGSRVGARAQQAAAERAAMRRTFSVLALTTFLGFAIFTGVGLASPLFPSTASPKSNAGTSAKTLVCPQTGCTASSCHADSGMTPAEFYEKNPAAVVKKRPAKKPRRRTTSFAHVPPMQAHLSALEPIVPATAKPAATAAPAATPARSVAPSKPAAKAASKPASKPKKLQTCPHTGCQRSSCHADFGKSASSFY